MPEPKVLILIPTYNNRSTLAEVARGALAVWPEVLVVDDGSTDGGMETLEGLGVEILKLPENQGKGKALQAGGRWALERGYSHVVTIDADGQHDPSEAGGFVERLREAPRAIIVGERDFSSPDVPGSSRFGRWWSNLWIRIASGATSTDSQSGYRAYPVEALTRLGCRAGRYNFEVEVLVRGAWAGLEIEALPVSIRYFSGDERVSHFRPFLDNWRISWTYTFLVIRNFLPWPHRALGDSDGREPAREGLFASLARFHRHLVRNLDEETEGLSLRHPIRSLKQLHVERTTPGEVAAACGLGVFLGALPLIACHTIVILFFATRLRLNRAVAFYASTICAPFIPPFVPALDIEVGFWMRHGRFLTLEDLGTKADLFRTLGAEAHLRLWEYFLGSLVVGPILALVVAGVAYWGARAWRRKFRREEGAA